MNNDNNLNNIYKKIAGLNQINSVINNSPIGSISKAMKDISGLATKTAKAQAYISVSKMKPLRINNAKLEDNILEEREKINELLAEVYLHQEKAAHLYNRLLNNPQSSKIIANSIYISLFLIITGIAIPLLVLPTDTYITIQTFPQILLEDLLTIKGLFVLISAILTGTIFITFLVKNNTMKYSKETMQKLQEITKLENYSEYFKNYAENTNT